MESFDFTSLYFTAGVVTVALITLTSLAYLCCHTIRSRSPKRTKLFGRIQETSSRVGLRRKTIRTDPFTVTGLDFLRRFEDSVSSFLYSILNEIAINRLQDHHISFHLKATPTSSDQLTPVTGQQYVRDYHWLVTHIYNNAREYTYLFAGVKERKVKDAVFTMRATPLPIPQLIESLQSTVGDRQFSVEVLHSISHQLRGLARELLLEINERGYGTQIQEGFDSFNKDIRDRVRNNVLQTAKKGHELVEILYNTIPCTTSSKTVKDQYGNVVKVYTTLVQEYIPYSELILQNKKAYQDMPPELRQEAILSALEEITAHAYNDEIWEILCMSVLPRFRKIIQQ